jgi:hypothetical protein
MWSRSPMGRRAEIFNDFTSSLAWVICLGYRARLRPLVTSNSDFGNWGVPRRAPID